jgi:hypothetical protein
LVEPTEGRRASKKNPRGRHQVRRQVPRGDLESFVLLDGSHYYYDATEAHKQLFIHACDLQLGRRPEPPEILTKICEARNPAVVLERFKPEHPESAFVNLAACYDTGTLVRERRLAPFEAEPPEDLSE